MAHRGRHGPPEAALALFRDAIGHWRASRSRPLLVTALRNLVTLLARTGRDQAAASLAATLRILAAPERGAGRGGAVGPDQGRTVTGTRWTALLA